jgi:anthranilate synthase component 1
VIHATAQQTPDGSVLIERRQGCVDLTRFNKLDPARYPFLLQSVARDEQSLPELARYDILFACPGESLELHADGVRLPTDVSPDERFLSALDSWWRQEYKARATDLPFEGGWFLYLGYELAQEVEPGLQLHADGSTPIAFATRVPVALINDRIAGELLLVAEESVSADELERIRRDMDVVSERLQQPSKLVDIAAITEDPADEFLEAVAKAKDHIRAGDIFQANLSRCWEAVLDDPIGPVELYRRLCATNPAPFAGLLVRPDFSVVSSSPERLVRRTGMRVDTRPIAGTRPRAADPSLARQSRADLLAHPKERAEHIMLIDLERNDLGRVCVGGSVTVDEFMVVESYSHVHHIVSNVTGQIRDDVTPGELIRAVFPGGTITGCPKVRCMEIIAALEDRERGAYTGSMGYLNRSGDCDLNILIRTMTLEANRIRLAAGSGIVADSDPLHELAETRAKAKGLLLALEGAGTDVACG